MIKLESSSTSFDLAALPLGKVKNRIRADLIASGHADNCGHCEKPFTAARKVFGVIRLVTLSEAGIAADFCLICRSCARKARTREARGGSVATEAARQQARRAHEAMLLLAVPAKGKA